MTLAEDEKAGSELERFVFEGTTGLYPHLTEDSEIFFEVGSDGALFEKQ